MWVCCFIEENKVLKRSFHDKVLICVVWRRSSEIGVKYLLFVPEASTMSKRNSDGAVSKGSPQSVEKTTTNKEGDDAPKRQKIMFNYTEKQFKPGEKGEALLKKGIQMKLGGPQKSSQKTTTGVVQPQSKSVAAVFNVDEEDEPKEMPPEARMRMRNIGRETPTSAGPNSFGKTKQGFCDAKKMFEKNMKKAMDSSDGGKESD